MPTAFAYLRETAMQSVDDQWATVAEYFARVLEPNGFDLDEEYFFDPANFRHRNFRQRNGARDAIHECKPGDCIIVVSMGNAFRSHGDFIEAQELLARHGIELHVPQGDAPSTLHEAKVRAELLADVAQAEHERNREVARERYAECRRQGKAIGRPPLGFRWMGPSGRRRLVPDNHDRDVMKLIRELSNRGSSLDAIHLFLLCKGIQRSTGREWCRTTIWKVLKKAQCA